MKNWKRQILEHKLFWTEKGKDCAKGLKDAEAYYQKKIDKLKKKLN